MKFSVTVTLKKDELDTQGKKEKKKKKNIGKENQKRNRQKKYFEIEINDNEETAAKKKVDNMCKKLLANLIIEDYKINKI